MKNILGAKGRVFLLFSVFVALPVILLGVSGIRLKQKYK